MPWLRTDIARFLLLAAGIFLGWYIIYDLWLLPDGRLDAWVAVNTASVSAGLLETLGYDVYLMGRHLGIGESAGIYLVDGCSGISAMGLFAGFILAFPGQQLPRWIFIVIGIGVIYLVNIFRNMILAVTQAHWPAFFDITHDYSTTAIFYLVIFGLWMIWVNYGEYKLET